MLYLILPMGVIIIFVIVLVQHGNNTKKYNTSKDIFLGNLGSTLDIELQKFFNKLNNGIKIVTVKEVYGFLYKNNSCTCIIVKYKIENDNNWYLGIVSESGVNTLMHKFNIATYMQEAYELLKLIYSDKRKSINVEYINSLPSIENIYCINLENEEKIIFNAILPRFGTETDLCLGNNVKFTLTNKRMIINNNLGVWTIDIYTDIADCTRNIGDKGVYFRIMLSELIIFGGNNDRLCSGFTFYFNGTDTGIFENIMKNLLI